MYKLQYKFCKFRAVQRKTINIDSLAVTQIKPRQPKSEFNRKILGYVYKKWTSE